MYARETTGEKIFYVVNYILIALIVACTLYPFLFIVSASFSDPYAIVRGDVILLPKGFNVDAYKEVFQSDELWNSYKNTMWYVIVGTFVNVLMTTVMAYPLSRKSFSGRKAINFFVAFTMFFTPPLVPTFLVVKGVGLMDSMWALVIPTAIDAFYLIIMRSFFEALPDSVIEAAKIDGCNEIQVLFRIVIRLSGPVMAVMVLFYAVYHWNSYFSALLYLNDNAKYPLQMILRKILLAVGGASNMTGQVSDRKDLISLSVRYATIIVSTVPILCVYPFLQKYFVKGIMIGAIKG